MLQKLVNELADIVYPKVCLACRSKIVDGSIDGLICAQCWARIKKTVPPFCVACGRHLEKISVNKNICVPCLKMRLHFDRAYSPCSYEGVIQKLIQEFKYKGKRRLGLPLSKLMVQFIKEYKLPMDIIDYVIPVPLHNTRLREREFNQAETLCRHICLEFSKSTPPGILQRIRNTRTQTELEPGERQENVSGSFSVARSGIVKGKHILLVDDVLTTGATCSEAARALKNSGAGIVFALTLAN